MSSFVAEQIRIRWVACVSDTMGQSSLERHESKTDCISFDNRCARSAQSGCEETGGIVDWVNTSKKRQSKSTASVGLLIKKDSTSCTLDCAQVSQMQRSPAESEYLIRYRSDLPNMR